MSKMGIVEEETDEAMYWMELIVESGMMEDSRISDLYSEANEIISMLVSSIKTARSKKK
ncbi:MAG: four helix bundle protein [Deltaproteobacteria bacterium]|nr:four helix bundle protein [Deltaproteobacteria bacterium]